MKSSLLRLFSGMAAATVLGCAVITLPAQVLVKNRITAPIRSDQMAVVRGGLHPLVAVAKDEGRLPGDYAIHGMELVFSRSAAQQADLNKLLAQQQTRGTSLFHQWLTPAQFAARYGVSQSDLQATAAWLLSQGLTIDQIPPSADRIIFSGTASQVAAAFHTEMHRYNLNGVENWANSTELSFPQAIAGMVLGVRNLDTFRPLPTHFRKTILHAVRTPGSTLTHPQYTLQNQNGQYMSFLAPADVQTIYDITPLYQAGVTGTGQFIGVMGQSNIVPYMSDITNFRALSGLSTSNPPQQVLTPGTGAAVTLTTGSNGGDLNESDLDVELSGAVAKDATILYVTVGNNLNYSVMDALQYAIQTPLLSYNSSNQLVLNTSSSAQYVIPVLSISYGSCEQQGWTSSDIADIVQLEQKANSQGQTVIASAGDDGSADCDGTVNNTTEYAATLGLAVDFPGSSPYTTSAGGTSFVGDRNSLTAYWNTTNSTTAAGATNGSAKSYIPEGAWNDSPTASMAESNGGLGAGGGGVSEVFNASPNYSLAASKAPTLPSSLSYLAGKPSWQSGPGVPGDGARDVPDVSLAADPDWDGYVVCTEETDSNNNLTGVSSCLSPSAISASNGQDVPYTDASGDLSSYGGTSASSPQLAAMITLWSQAAGYGITSNSKGGVGNANYIFYQLAQTTPSAFHDVVSNTIYPEANSNAVVCQDGTPSCILSGGNYVMGINGSPAYSVGPGYDLATGLGSVDVAAMAAVWGSASASGDGFNPTTGAPTPDFQIVANPAKAGLAPGSSTYVTINVAPLNGFVGTVTLSCAGPSNNPGITCSLSSPTVTLGTSGSTTLTIMASSSANLRTPRLFPGKSSPGGPWRPFTGGGAAFAGLLLLGLPAQRRRFLSRLGKQARWMTMATLLLVVCIGATLGCGGSSATSTTTPSTPSSTSMVTVTATSGSGTSATTHSITIACTVS